MHKSLYQFIFSNSEYRGSIVVTHGKRKLQVRTRATWAEMASCLVEGGKPWHSSRPASYGSDPAFGVFHQETAAKYDTWDKGDIMRFILSTGEESQHRTRYS